MAKAYSTRQVIHISDTENWERIYSEQKQLLLELNLLQNKVDSRGNACVAQLITTRSKLQTIQKKRNTFQNSKCPQIRGEQNSHCPKNHSQNSKRMQSLRSRDGGVTPDAVEMADECRHFYSALYTAVSVEQTEMEFFLDSMDRSLAPIAARGAGDLVRG